MRTKIPGVYAIGDVREKHCVKSRQRSVKAVLLDNKYLTILKIKIKNAFAFNNKGKSIF